MNDKIRLGWHWTRNKFRADQDVISEVGPVIRELLRRVEQLEELLLERDHK